MPRNFDRRVETVAPIEDPSLHERLDSLFRACLQDNRQAWMLQTDGTYVQRHPEEGEPERGTHALLLKDSWGRV
jgi:polyphosphate kinase